MEAELPPPSRTPPRWMVAVILALVLASAVLLAWQRKTANHLVSENQQMTLALQQTQAQLDAMKAKLESLTPPPAAMVSQEKPSPAVTRQAGVKHAVTHRRSAADPRWKQLQSRLDEQGRQIDATRQDLSNTRTELQGSIAKTHDELVVLEHKGERSYFEFDLDKSKQFRASGPVGIRLKKANTKHSFADLELMVDDVKLSKKHVNLYEPVVFYSSDDGRPVELVINSVTKNHIHGYVASPKYSKTELAAMSGIHGTDANGNPLPARKKLELPKE